jgi:hypothetical protein
METEEKNQISTVDSKNAIKQQKPTMKVGEINALYLIDRAIENNIDIEKFEKLITLAQMLEQEKAKRDFFEALSKFQSNLPPIYKDSVVNMGYGKPKYNYASLPKIIEDIQKPLGDNGLSYRWEIDNSTEKIKVTCYVMHNGGYEIDTFIEADKDASPGKSNVQAIGSTISYLKRYTLCALLGIGTADPDDDAQATVNIDKKQEINDKDKIIEQIKSELKSCKDEDGVKRIWIKYQKYSSDKDILQVFTDWRKNQTNEKINKTNNNIKIEKGGDNDGELQL